MTGGKPPAKNPEGGADKAGKLDGSTMLFGIAGGAETLDIDGENVLAGWVGEEEMANIDRGIVLKNSSESEAIAFGYFCDSDDCTSSGDSSIDWSDAARGDMARS